MSHEHGIGAAAFARNIIVSAQAARSRLLQHASNELS